MKKHAMRFLAFTLCACTLLCMAPAALAATTGVVAISTPVFAGASAAQSVGAVSGTVNILGEEGEYYQISVQDSTTGTQMSGYIAKSAVTLNATNAATLTADQAAQQAAATAGYITNCDSYVYMRSTPSSSGDKTKIKKNVTFTILGTEGEYTKIQTADGAVAYVASKYVATGTPSAASSAASGDTAAPAAEAEMLKEAVPMVSISKTIYIRKSTDSSTKSKNLVKKISSAKGKVFTVLGMVGTSQYYVTYGEYTGYVNAKDFASATSAAQLTYATGDKSKDKWGEVVKIEGTNIGSAYGQLYDNNIYCNGMNSSGSDYYYNSYSGKKNYFYMLSPQNAPIAVLMTHNMRSSLTGGHYLHHIQNAFLGVSKCESCKKSCSTKTQAFQISYEKHTTWQLIGFFEGNASMRNYTAVNYGVTGAQKDAWIAQTLSYCTSKYKGAVLDSATSADDIMMIITCGDKGSKAGTFLCMMLKGI